MMTSSGIGTRTPQRQALVEQLLRRKGIQRAGASTIPPRAQFSPCDLSFAQQALWLAVQLDPGRAAYHIPLRLRLRGALDVAAVADSLNALIARHEALRTSFGVIDGSPRQIVHARCRLSVPLIDLGALTDDQRRERLARRLAGDHARALFDLTRPPLLRAAVVRLDATDHLLLFAIHHIVADGWSMNILLREFAGHYRAHVEGVAGQAIEPAAPVLRVHYPDFAVWQRARAGGEAFEAQVARWRERLADLPPTELPATPPRVRTGRGGAEPMVASPDLAAVMGATCRRASVTPFVTWVAAIAAWLHRYTGQQDIAIGAPLASRLQRDLEPLIGCFVNPIVLRIRVAGTDRFDDLLRQVHGVALDAFADQDVPFERVVEAVAARGGRGDDSPLFRVACVLHNAPAAAGRVDLPGLQISPFDTPGGPARFDLEVNVWQSGDRLGGTLIYDADRFDRPMAARMAGHLLTLLRDSCEQPQRSIAELSFLSAAEREAIAWWNATTRVWSSGETAAALIDEQIARTPQAAAAADDDGVWTYGELSEAADRIAAAVRAAGVRHGSRVALRLRRSKRAIAAIVGILRAGGVYVPLDINAPSERWQRQLLDAGATLVMTDDDVEAWLSRAHDRQPSEAVDVEDLAYVMYTSGSTGEPKGVMVTHGGLANYLRWARETYPLGPGEATVFHTSLAFDLTVTSVLLPLVMGGCIRIVAEGDDLDGLVRACTAPGDDFGYVKLTPSHLRALADLADPAAIGARTRAFVVGGEALDAALVDRWLTAAPSLRIFNEYGPTETVVGCCVQELRGTRLHTDPISIGRPIANTALYVVGPHAQLAPIGVTGELWIGGRGLARGYLDRPDLTAARFVPDAFGAPTNAGGRLYRTGDRVRWREDGTLEYLGRADQQIKIRGHRIEPGEIETVLREQPGIDDAAVVVQRDPRGAPSIVAYVVTKTIPSQEEVLRHALRARLPEPMMPSVFVPLPALPLTASGKVDRRRLPSAVGAHDSRQETVASRLPRTPLEAVIAAIWADVLDVDEVSLDDNFFERGGHSLLGTRVLARIRQACGVDLPLRTLFDAPTVAALAARVANADTPVSLPPIVPVAREGPLPLSFAQQRLWFLHHLDPGSGFLTMPVVVRLRGPASVTALRSAIAALRERHETLRTTFAFEGRELVQRIHPAATPLPIVSLTALDPSRQTTAATRLIDAEAGRPFDLARGPLFRAILVELAEDDHILLGAIHHIVSDGWSNGILSREFGVLYDAHLVGRRAALPPSQLQYADFAFWQRRTLPDAVFEQHLAYWREQLDGVSDEELFPAPAGRPARGARRRGLATVTLGEGLTQAIARLARRQDVTPFMCLLAAYEIVLHAASGRHLFAIGTDVAGRRDPQLESVVGCFVNQIVLRADLRDDPTFASLLARVRASLLGADEHQELPFERLVQALRPRRDPGRHPLVQATIVFENTPAARVDLPSVALEPFGFRVRDTKSDVNLVLSDSPAGLAARLEYDTDLFNPSTAAAFVERFRQLLHAAIRQPDLRASALSAITTS